ncbi:DUF998 domain-containing protein [Dactylosporangium vinaceum]|uniref:DUF998 domain-containing protein n=1 Tax=Dactylosporangium vinaceum TaxID=53362 RepID=A0ABV5LYF3_9ACTN|nr:DUF998 domain-containing protein [Dactylosporangium vinaceum]UAB95886.1 DUF998 domain-containing protein [Dactylosporangium vinaceum]
MSPRTMAAGAVAGPILFTVAWLILGFVSPGFTLFDVRVEPYSAISAQISGLGLGPTAPYMNAAFVLTGVLLGVGVVGSLRCITALTPRSRRTLTALLSLVAIGCAADGIFTLESFKPHLLGAMLAFCSPVISFWVTGSALRRIPGWRRFGTWLRFAAPVTLGLVAVYLATFDPTVEGSTTGVSGLLERIVVIEILGWFAALGWLARRRAFSGPTGVDGGHGSAMQYARTAKRPRGL